MHNNYTQKTNYFYTRSGGVVTGREENQHLTKTHKAKYKNMCKFCLSALVAGCPGRRGLWLCKSNLIT